MIVGFQLGKYIKTCNGIFFHYYFILEFGFGVPVVTVVLEGGEDALKAVKESVKHGIPAVVVEGTGRAAEILAFAHHNCECHRQV